MTVVELTKQLLKYPAHLEVMVLIFPGRLDTKRLFSYYQLSSLQSFPGVKTVAPIVCITHKDAI